MPAAPWRRDHPMGSALPIPLDPGGVRALSGTITRGCARIVDLSGPVPRPASMGAVRTSPRMFSPRCSSLVPPGGQWEPARLAPRAAGPTRYASSLSGTRVTQVRKVLYGGQGDVSVRIHPPEMPLTRPSHDGGGSARRPVNNGGRVRAGSPSLRRDQPTCAASVERTSPRMCDTQNCHSQCPSGRGLAVPSASPLAGLEATYSNGFVLRSPKLEVRHSFPTNHPITQIRGEVRSVLPPQGEVRSQLGTRWSHPIACFPWQVTATGTRRPFPSLQELAR